MPLAPHTPARHLGLVERLGSFGRLPALATERETIDYRDLAARVAERARELGAGRRLVAVQGGNDPQTLISYLGALHGGHVPWLLSGAPEAAQALVDHFDPDVVVRADDDGARIDERRAGSAHELHPELALLMATSGSTGAPRLVRLSYDGLQSNAEAIAGYLGIDASERPVTTLPLHYCYGLSVVNSHLLRGACLLLTGRSVTDPELWAMLRAHGGTSLAGVPHTFELLDRVGFADMDLPSLRYVTQAGGRLDPERVRRYARLGERRGWRLIVMYGQTEATARMAYLPPALAAERPEAIGVPIPGGRLEVRPVDGEERPGVGELVYRGPNVMLGYARAAGDLAAGREVHELRTGDLGRRGADGLFEVVGRRARFVKLVGLRVDLDGVERILAERGLEAACAGTDGRLVVAVVGAAPPGLARALARRLRVPWGTIEVRSVGELPRLPNGKRDDAALLRPVATGAVGADDDAGDVAAAFRRVLGRETVRDDDTFARLGGDSLSYVEMSLALEDALGHLPPGWPEMTVAELSALRRPARGRGTRVETNVALRAGAIVLVVLSHMTAFWPAGGAHLLLALAGHSFARFQLGVGDGTRRLARAGASIARIAVPSSAWIGLNLLLAGTYSVGAVLLVNNYTGAQSHSDGRWHYWFIEALVQILIVMALLLAIPGVRRLERRHGFAFVMVLLGLALVWRFELLALGADDNLIFRPHAVVWIFLLGWAAQRATTPARRLAVSALVLATVPGFFGQGVREAIVAGGLLALVWVPTVPVSRAASRLIGVVASASLFIYLTHWQAFPPLQRALPLELAMPLTVAVGVGAWALVSRLSDPATWRAARRALGPGGSRAGGGGRPQRQQGSSSAVST